MSANQALIYMATLRELPGLTSPPKVLTILDYHWEQIIVTEDVTIS